MFALQWPITFRKNNPNNVDKSKLVKQWTIHGIWPDLIKNCKPTEPFNETKLISIKSELHAIWPNFIKGKSDANFWDHEWYEHGSCTGWTINNYFEKGIDLWNNFPVIKWFESASIKPSNNPETTYSLANVEAALFKGLESTDSVAVNCLKNL